MATTLLKNVQIINEGMIKRGHIVINNDLIDRILEEGSPISTTDLTLECEGMFLIPGVIDDQVHFREPGLTHKGDIASESRSAIAGGVTSFMEMPNTNPQTVTQINLEEKYLKLQRIF